METLGPCTHVHWGDDDRITVIQWFDGAHRALGHANQLHLYTQTKPGVLTKAERVWIHARACENHALRRDARRALKAERRAAALAETTPQSSLCSAPTPAH